MAGKDATRRRWVRWLIVAVLVAGIGYGVLGVALFIRGKPTISVNYAVEYNQRLRPAGLDPNDNAASDYEAAFAQMPEMPDDVRQILGRLHKYEPSSVERRIMEEWTASCDKALRIVRRAAQKPDFWVELPTIDFSDPASVEMIHFSKFRDATLALRCQAELLAAKGDLAGAMDHVYAICKMARHMGGRGRMQINLGQAMETVAYSTAFDLLSRAEVDSSGLGEVQKRFEEIVSHGSSLSFAGDEILLRDAIQRHFTDDGHGSGRLIPGGFYDLRCQGPRSDLPRSELASNAFHLKCVYIAWAHPTRRETTHTLERLVRTGESLLAQTPWEMHAKGTSHADQLRAIARANDFLQFVGADTTLSWTIEGYHRAKISGQALVAAIAALRFQKDTGGWPQSLERLVATGYIREIPIDPYSGKPLAYKLTTDSFALYSYGQDFDDDGGAASQWGRPPQGGDQVFWPVEKR